jgi:peroxin-16
MDAAPQSLTGTLIQALTQGEALQRQLNESVQTIERLQAENERLKREVDDLRQKQRVAPDMTAQFDQLFRKDVENQAKIDQLKSKLRLAEAKGRKWRGSNALACSPTISSDEASTSNTPSNTNRKRARSRSPEALKEISVNVATGRNASNQASKFKRFSDRGAEAIPSVAEDGEDYNLSRPKSASGKASHAKDTNSPLQRLQALLSGPAPASPLLLSSSSANSSSPGGAAVDEQAKPQTPVTSTTETPTNVSKAGFSKRPPFLPAQARSAAVPDPEDEEPFRSRPVHRLNLSHFKVNPAHTGGLDYAFDEVVRGRDARKCLPGCTRPECCGSTFKALAATLPADQDISDHDLLLDFLGPGSGEKIRTLTPIARTNLLHEARAKRLADLYGKVHRANFERARSPPGFWDTHMPSTQEDKENREQARLREREEVERRYRDANTGKGRWMFADE